MAADRLAKVPGAGSRASRFSIVFADRWCETRALSDRIDSV
jgi:hypothetical protein